MEHTLFRCPRWLTASEIYAEETVKIFEEADTRYDNTVCLAHMLMVRVVLALSRKEEFMVIFFFTAVFRIQDFFNAVAEMTESGFKQPAVI